MCTYVYNERQRERGEERETCVKSLQHPDLKLTDLGRISLLVRTECAQWLRLQFQTSFSHFIMHGSFDDIKLSYQEYALYVSSDYSWLANKVCQQKNRFR